MILRLECKKQYVLYTKYLFPKQYLINMKVNIFSFLIKQPIVSMFVGLDCVHFTCGLFHCIVESSDIRYTLYKTTKPCYSMQDH